MSEKVPENQIDYVEFPAIDIERTKKFYGAAFGWTFEDFGPKYTSFKDGRLSGGFTTGSPASPGGILIVLYSSNLTAAVAKIKSAGGEIVKEIFSFPGGKRFHFADPNGNQLAMWSDQ